MALTWQKDVHERAGVDVDGGDAAEAHRSYQVLGLPEGTALSEVRRAYRSLVKTWHPDRYMRKPKLQATATTFMEEINAAYRLLTSLPEYSDAHVAKHAERLSAAARVRTARGVPSSGRRSGKTAWRTEEPHPGDSPDKPVPSYAMRSGAPPRWGAILLAVALLLVVLVMVVPDSADSLGALIDYFGNDVAPDDMGELP